jgi:hypothetical protein
MTTSRPHVLHRLEQTKAAVGRGWALTPLRGKIPILDGWNSAPKADETQVKTWAEEGNLGLRTGAASGVFVIDEDTDKGGDVRELGLPQTWTVITGGGGRHYYFRHAGDLGNSASKLGPHIDTRGEGGQVVFVGSIHPNTGRMYRWAEGLSPDDGLELAELPQEVLETLLPKKPPARRETAPSRSATAPRTGHRTDYAQEALKREVDEVLGAPPGTGNDKLNIAAFNLGQLVAGGQIGEMEVRTALMEAATSGGRRTAQEAQSTISSGLHRGQERPRYPRGRPRLAASSAKPQPEPEEPEEPGKPSTLTPGAHVDRDGEYLEVGNHQFVDRVLETLPQGVVYRRGGSIGELAGAAGQRQFRGVTLGRVRTIVDRHIRLTRWFTPRRKNARPEVQFIPTTYDQAGLILEGAIHAEELRQLDLLTSYPVAWGPNSEPLSPGWNERALAYYDRPPDLGELELITAPAAIKATLEDLVVDFPFADEASRANFFGLLLTPIMRPTIEGNVPMHLIASPLERTGKTKLAEEVWGGVILGRPTPAIQLTGNDDERDKRILALLLRGDTLVHLDNIRQYLDSAALASLLTSSTYSGRPMAKTEIASPPNTLTVVASGNNVRMSGELAKRTVPIILHPADDHPEDRTDYRHPDLRGYIRQVRPQVLGTLLGMVDNWRQAGRPLAPGPIGGFERWSGIIGGILQLAGFEAWRSNVKAWSRKANRQDEDLERFVECWADIQKAPGRGRLKAKELFLLAEEVDLFQGLIRGTTDHGRLQSFARQVLQKNEDRPVKAWIIKSIGYGSTSLWYLEERSELSDSRVIVD